ncbi:hypothetical protein N7533_011136 [Penicillium manginii]|uniref:uncharacterized protein n=1 Tax=Penicillium manginii TaxID=203109 RepID=UPI002546BA27|nr:uncharacterized protein N7533_011136 [Penicillium manginii]KAJ5741727.1 hypothetical protein N7533_011136 [Penicillium manginii]
MTRDPRNHSTEVLQSPTPPSHQINLNLTPHSPEAATQPNPSTSSLYETNCNDEFTLSLTSPGLPIVPSSPFYRTLQDLWSQHGNRDETPSPGLIRAVAAEVQRQPRLCNYSIYRSWMDHQSDLQYVLLQSRPGVNAGRNDSWMGYLGLANARRSPRRNRFLRALEQGYLAEGSSEEN